MYDSCIGEEKRRRLVCELGAATLGQRCSAMSDCEERGQMLLCPKVQTFLCCLSLLIG